MMGAIKTMSKFLDRIQQSDIDIDYIKLNEAEADLYQGAGHAIVFAHADGFAEKIIYLHDILEDGAKDVIEECYTHGDAYLCMCSAYEFVDIKSMSDIAMAARVMRLVAENYEV
tara:strand:+ start:384 stop:725 length:342 start_codon:yes stop_codon:yes gene_type:complete